MASSLLVFGVAFAAAVAAAAAAFQTPAGYNCEELTATAQVRWKIVDQSIKIELLGKIKASDYMAFGPSGSNSFSLMTGSDPVVVDYATGSARARDYYITGRGVCNSRDQGVCPDTQLGANNNVRGVSGMRDASQGLTLVRFTRPLKKSDSKDDALSKNRQYISYAIGPMGADGLPRKHTRTPSQTSIVLGRRIADNCRPLSAPSVDCVGLLKVAVRKAIRGKTCQAAKIRTKLTAQCNRGLCDAPVTATACRNKLTRKSATLARKFCD